MKRRVAATGESHGGDNTHELTSPRDEPHPEGHER